MPELHRADPAQLDNLLEEWSTTFDEHVAALDSYLDALDDARGDLTAARVLRAAREARSGIWLLAHTQPRDPANGFIDWRDEAVESDEGSGASPIWNPPDAPPSTRFTELPGVVAYNRVVDEGPWGSVRLVEALVYSDGVEFVLERVQLRGAQSLEAWRARDVPFGGEPGPDGATDAWVSGAAHGSGEVSGQESADEYRGTRIATVSCCVVGPFTGTSVTCTLAAEDPDAGVIVFEADAAELDSARSSIVSVLS